MRKHWRGVRYRHNLEGYGISACSEFLFFPLFPKLENNESLKQIICQKGKVPWKQETVIYFTSSIGNGKKKKIIKRQLSKYEYNRKKYFSEPAWVNPDERKTIIALMHKKYLFLCPL